MRWAADSARYSRATFCDSWIMIQGPAFKCAVHRVAFLSRRPRGASERPEVVTTPREEESKRHAIEIRNFRKNRFGSYPVTGCFELSAKGLCPSRSWLFS